ncbi:hypothetical protein JCM8097_007416 [Rhodosporidiobolus ruineniae]
MSHDYFSFPRSEDIAGVAESLLTPAETEGYISPLDSPVYHRSLSSRLGEAAALPLPSPAETISPAGEKEDEGTEQAKESTRSPSALVTVLNQDAQPPPPASARFLHGGPPLSELEAPSVNVPQSERKDRPVANSEWRAFTDEEEERLQEAWRKLQEDKEALARAAARAKEKSKEKEKGKGKEKARDDGDDPDDDPYVVPVGLDSLFSVDLAHKILYPAFWQGSPVRVILSHWIYAPPSVAANAHTLHSHHLKPFPVDPSLSSALDKAFAQIRPWEAAYADELSSALKGGAEAQQKLAVALAVENEAETGENRDLGIEVIFETKDRARLFSRGMLGSMSKSFFSGKGGLGGGQVVLRGWDALRDYLEEKAPKKPTPARTAKTSTSTASDGESTTSHSASPVKPTAHSRTASTSSSAAGAEIKRSDSPGFFSSLKNRLVGAPAPTDDSHPEVDDASLARRSLEGAGPGSLPNDTQTALAREPRGEDNANIGAVDELVLVVHGIGQGLATSYESFAFTYAANAFRSACTTLSTSEHLSPLLKGKRAQFIPVLWRTDLDFEAVDDADETADEHLANRFGIKDIEVSNSVPLLRQVVSGLVLDVPFYLTPTHKDKMLRSVVREANRIYRLFCKRNPSFGGKVSIIGHSLGSCLVADILSAQPTFVKELSKPSMRQKHDPALTFAFDTRVVFLVGSPLAFFLYLGKGQLIARARRERTKGVGKDIALDRAGRYGCMSCDAVYNVYHETDPVVFALNPTVDVHYAKIIKPVPIPSSNATLLQNLSDAYHRVSAIFDWSSLWSSAQPTGEQAKEQAKKQDEEKKDKVEGAKKPQMPPRRPTAKRMPTQSSKYGVGTQEHEWVARAEQRFRALNPSGTCDYVLPAEGINQYVDALFSHAGYWTDKRFSTFVLTQLFAADEDLEKAGREQVGIEEEEEPAEED